MLAAAPRWAVHKALAECEPGTYWAAAVQQQEAEQQLGVLPSMEDAAIAYRLLLEVCTHSSLCSPLHMPCEYHASQYLSAMKYITTKMALMQC